MTTSPRPRRRPGNHRGMSMIEMMIALFISTVFMLAAGTAYLVNQKAYRANTEKLRLQQRAAEVLEIMEREIRKGASVTIPNGNSDRIQVFKPDGTFVKEQFIAKGTKASGSAWDVAFSPDPQPATNSTAAPASTAANTARERNTIIDLR